MRRNFDQIMVWLAAYEGGFVNHPSDPGGATNRGVTQAVYDAFRRRHGQPTRSVRALTDAEHDAIYLHQYWMPVRGDDLPSGLDATVFDFAVNSGVSRSVKTLQRALNAKGAGLAVDGQIGELTLAAIDDVGPGQGVVELIVDVNERRLAFVKRLSTFKTFGRGWTRRIMGEQMGVQADDLGVIDRSMMLARDVRHSNIPKPKAPGAGPARGADAGWLGALIQAIADLIADLTSGRKRGAS